MHFQVQFYLSIFIEYSCLLIPLPVVGLLKSTESVFRVKSSILIIKLEYSCLVIPLAGVLEC